MSFFYLQTIFIIWQPGSLGLKQQLYYPANLQFGRDASKTTDMILSLSVRDINATYAIILHLKIILYTYK